MKSSEFDIVMRNYKDAGWFYIISLICLLPVPILNFFDFFDKPNTWIVFYISIVGLFAAIFGMIGKFGILIMSGMLAQYYNKSVLFYMFGSLIFPFDIAIFFHFVFNQGVQRAKIFSN
jgi:hypothetical protein